MLSIQQIDGQPSFSLHIGYRGNMVNQLAAQAASA